MPMIDVYAPEDLFPADADSQLGNELTHAVLSVSSANSWGNRRCRFIVHIADLSALVLIHEFPERTTKCPTCPGLFNPWFCKFCKTIPPHTTYWTVISHILTA